MRLNTEIEAIVKNYLKILSEYFRTDDFDALVNYSQNYKVLGCIGKKPACIGDTVYVESNEYGDYYGIIVGSRGSEYGFQVKDQEDNVFEFDSKEIKEHTPCQKNIRPKIQHIPLPKFENTEIKDFRL